MQAPSTMPATRGFYKAEATNNESNKPQLGVGMLEGSGKQTSEARQEVVQVYACASTYAVRPQSWKHYVSNNSIFSSKGTSNESNKPQIGVRMLQGVGVGLTALNYQHRY
jgi:hypothetical protein